ncbi:MAG: hypothetical protein J6O23_05350 [Prevotella sp.]|nr:hypothetical protein [Prevotella sp.]
MDVEDALVVVIQPVRDIATQAVIQVVNIHVTILATQHAHKGVLTLVRRDVPWDVERDAQAHVRVLAVLLVLVIQKVAQDPVVQAVVRDVAMVVPLVARVDAKAVVAQAAQEDVLAVVPAAALAAVTELVKLDVKEIAKNRAAEPAKMDAKAVKEAALIPAQAVEVLAKVDATA